MKADERLRVEVVRILRETVADAGGNEVFAVGGLDSDGLVAT